MNKNIKRIISIALAIGVISAVAPTTNMNLLTTKVYAADDNKEDYLDSLILYDEDGDDIKLYSDTDYSDKVDDDDIEEGEIYYTKTSSDTVSIDIEGPSDKYVKVFTGSSSSSKGNDVGDDIEISDNSTTTLIIKVYGKEPDDDMRYKDNDDYNVLSTYRVKVEYTGDNNGTKSDNIYLERLSINNKMIDLSDSKTKYTYNVDSDVNEVTIRATPEDDDYDVTIDGKRVHSSDNYKETLDLDKGTNEFEIEIEDNDIEKTYTLVINRGKPSLNNASAVNNTKNAEDYDDIYLNKLSIDGKVIPLSKSNINYTNSVPSYVDEVTIKAEPEKDHYTVIVGNDEVYEDEDYKTTVHLNNGENAIKIALKNDNSDEERVYILTVTRGNASSTSATTSTQGDKTDITAAKTNQWVQVDGVWKYNDASGNPVKNTWVQNYYLLDNGNMATGWLNYSGSWYYLGSDGAKKTGWQSIDGNWYHLDSQGKVQTGWFKDLDGKYYYLNSYGAMAYNTTIEGYKIGSNGAWTGR